MELSIQTFLFKIRNLNKLFFSFFVVFYFFNPFKLSFLSFLIVILFVSVEVAENAEKKIWIKLYDNKYFYENFNLNFSLQNKQLQQILLSNF